MKNTTTASQRRASYLVSPGTDPSDSVEDRYAP
jgi:hypothetical protein